MPRYIPYNYRQQLLMSISLEEQVRPGTLEFIIHQTGHRSPDLVQDRVAGLFQRHHQLPQDGAGL